jgi:putative lipoprotein
MIPRGALLLAVSLLACGTRTPSPAPPPIADRDWELVALGQDTNPRGAGGRPVTLRLDAAGGRASGFAGCNRYGAGYTLDGDRLTFGAPISTRMACAEGMQLESAFLAMLPSVTTYEATGSTLVLRGAGGPLARLRTP